MLPFFTTRVAVTPLVAEGKIDPCLSKTYNFDDIAEFADRFTNQMIVLTHFSRRYSREEIRDTLRRRCPAVLRDRIRLALPHPFTTLQ